MDFRNDKHLQCDESKDDHKKNYIFQKADQFGQYKNPKFKEKQKIYLEPKMEKNQLYRKTPLQRSSSQAAQFQTNDPINEKQQLAYELWGSFKEKIFQTEKPIIKAVERQLKMTNKTSDFLTKLDLIDTHP